MGRPGASGVYLIQHMASNVNQVLLVMVVVVVVAMMVAVVMVMPIGTR